MRKPGCLKHSGQLTVLSQQAEEAQLGKEVACAQSRTLLSWDPRGAVLAGPTMLNGEVRESYRESYRLLAGRLRGMPQRKPSRAWAEEGLQTCPPCPVYPVFSVSKVATGDTHWTGDRAGGSRWPRSGTVISGGRLALARAAKGLPQSY